MRKSKVHPETGEKLTRGVRPFTVRFAGLARTVDLPGWYPARKNGEGLHVGSDMAAADRALAELKAECRGCSNPTRCVRFVCGSNSRSERPERCSAAARAHFRNTKSGEVVVSKPMAQLLRLLARDPRRLNELIRRAAA